MLVLTRKTQERIQIGDSITITILRVKGQAVRIGIEAPEGVRILRGELALRDLAALESEAAADSAESEPAPRRGRQAEVQMPRERRMKPQASASLLQFRTAPTAALGLSTS